MTMDEPLSSPPPPVRRPQGDPWVETRAGSLFFVNLLLVSPALVVLVPLLLRGLLRVAGKMDRPSPILDTIPVLAGLVVPWVGWLALLPAWLVVRNLRMALPTPARRALLFFLFVHLATVAWAAGSWLAPAVGS